MVVLMLKLEDIKKYISESDNKTNTGLNYYNEKHDIMASKIYYYNAEGQLVEDKENSNARIPHAFFRELVDQKKEYILSGKGKIIKSKIPELQTELDKYFGDKFKAELSKLIKYSAASGWSYLYAKKGADERITFSHAKGLNVIEVPSEKSGDGKDYIIYQHTKVGNNDDVFIQIWDSKGVAYFKQNKDGKIEKDTSQKINPRPHIIYTIDDDVEYETFDFIPFFKFGNTEDSESDLTVSVKSLIDDYDIHACGLSNNLIDIAEGYFVVKGAQGHSIEEITRNLRVKHGVGVPNEGDVSIQTVDIPYEARLAKMEIDKQSIYKFGRGFDSTQVGDGNITNVVIKSRYSLLDMKCSDTITLLKGYLSELIEIVLDEINMRKQKSYEISDVAIEFAPEIITNERDNAEIEKLDAERDQVVVNTLLNIQTQIPEEELIKRICETLSIDYEKEVKGKMKPHEQTAGGNTEAARAKGSGNIEGAEISL